MKLNEKNNTVLRVFYLKKGELSKMKRTSDRIISKCQTRSERSFQIVKNKKFNFER